MAEERVLYISPSELAVTISEHGTVGLFLGRPDDRLGIAPGLALAIEMSPAESRHLARMLLRKADEAEAEAPRH
jgi:hypothetical protein